MERLNPFGRHYWITKSLLFIVFWKSLFYSALICSLGITISFAVKCQVKLTRVVIFQEGVNLSCLIIWHQGCTKHIFPNWVFFLTILQRMSTHSALILKRLNVITAHWSPSNILLFSGLFLTNYPPRLLIFHTSII